MFRLVLEFSYGFDLSFGIRVGLGKIVGLECFLRLVLGYELVLVLVLGSGYWLRLVYRLVQFRILASVRVSV